PRRRLSRSGPRSARHRATHLRLPRDGGPPRAEARPRRGHAPPEGVREPSRVLARRLRPQRELGLRSTRAPIRGVSLRSLIPLAAGALTRDWARGRWGALRDTRRSVQVLTAYGPIGCSSLGFRPLGPLFRSSGGCGFTRASRP